MARCIICKKTIDEVQLYPGVLDSEMVNICEACAESENVPIIKKPSESQLDKADQKFSVRERMERISGMRNTTEISPDQTIAQGNLARLKIPPKKEHHQDIMDNYYWTLNIARRRAKLTTNQLAKKIQTSPETIQQIEKGKIPENFEEIFVKLEAFLGIKLLKNHKKQVHFIKPTKDEADRILEEVRKKMEFPGDNQINPKEKKEKLEKLSKGEIDFSKREDLSNITLNDLVEMKRKREKKESRKKAELREEAMLGDDIEIEEI